MSVIEDMRKVLQDFLAPELRAIAVRMDGVEKQRAEDKAELQQQRAEDKAELQKQRAEDKADILRAITESRLDTQRAITDSTSSMQKRFELVIDYTKVLQRIDRIEESQQEQAKNH